ncbi:MerR family transcriptional regulator [Streptomyces sp. NPDC088915]|uniref:MerR family transcriptional regulator n=1 Tax=Streptomyces sp. NPDC088915 TaxID=3365912 RepID=UPI00381C7D78
MRIGDAAGTTPRALRLSEQRGLLPPPVRTPSGRREHGPDDVARVRVVRELLALGLTIEDVRACVDRRPEERTAPPGNAGTREGRPGTEGAEPAFRG